jgi:hypothetical protein
MIDLYKKKSFIEKRRDEDGNSGRNNILLFAHGQTATGKTHTYNFWVR